MTRIIDYQQPVNLYDGVSQIGLCGGYKRLSYQDKTFYLLAAIHTIMLTTLVIGLYTSVEACV